MYPLYVDFLGDASISFNRRLVLVPFDSALKAIKVLTAEAPTGQNLILDVRQVEEVAFGLGESTSLFTDQGLRPTVIAGQNFSAPVDLDIPLDDRAVLSVEFYQVGSVRPGSGVQVILLLEERTV